MKNRYKLNIEQSLNITAKLPKDWEQQVTALNIKYDFIYDEGIEQCTAERKDKDKIIRSIEVFFDSDESMLTNNRHDEDELVWLVMDNIKGYKKTPKFCKWKSETASCELYVENIDDVINEASEDIEG